MRDNSKSSSLHLSGLNGIRAIAAMGVIICHITATFYWPETLSGKNKPLAPGLYVSMFFALSGFLITYLLLLEKEKGISIRNFYLRRALRIWPLYYAVLILTMVVVVVNHIPFRTDSLLFTIFFGANFPYIRLIPVPHLSHFWSIGVEEQFYLFWPLIVKKVSSIKTLTTGIIAFIVFMVAAETCARYFAPGQYQSFLYRLIHFCSFQCMAIGALAAIYYYADKTWFTNLSTHVIVQSIAWISMVLVVFNKFCFISFLDNNLICIVAVFLIMGQITKRNNIINLENRFFDFIGKISFGIYLIHGLVMYFAERYLWPIQMNEYLKFVVVYSSIIGVTILLAQLSYQYLEKPFLKLKKRFEIVKSSPKMS